MKVITIEKVRFSETDMMGVVHHANYLHWMENGRVELLRSLGIYLLDLIDDGILFPIVKVECQYHKPACFGDEIRVETTLCKCTKVKLEFSYEIYKNSENIELLASGESKNVYINDKGVICRLPDKYFAKFQEA